MKLTWIEKCVKLWKDSDWIEWIESQRDSSVTIQCQDEDTEDTEEIEVLRTETVYECV